MKVIILKGLALLSLIIIFAGCSKHIPLTVESDPPGAYIYLDGEFKGITPKIITYHYDPNIRPLEIAHEKKLRLSKEGYRSKEITISILTSIISEKKKIVLEAK